MHLAPVNALHRRRCQLSINIVSSFKALKPVQRKRRSSQEPKNLSSSDRARRRAIKEQLVCWVVFVSRGGEGARRTRADLGVQIALAWGEKLADRTLGWVVPFYSQIKLVLLLFMLAWRSAVNSAVFRASPSRWLTSLILQGAQIIFKKVIKPLVLPYERPLDAVGYILNEVIQLVVAALLIAPRRVGQWWQGKAKESNVRHRGSCSDNPEADLLLQIPSIRVGLRSPHRSPLAHTLASSIDSAQARSDAEITKRLSRPIVTSQPEPPPAPSAPKPTLRRSPSTTSLSASTSQRPTSAPFRPIRPTNPREHLSLSASTSRLPRTSNGDASTSRLGANTSVYPSLSASQGPSEIWGTNRASTSRPLVPSSSFKGKQRQTFEPLAVPSPPSSSLHGSRHSLNTSTAPPVPIHLGRSSTAARNSLAIPQPPSPPPPQHSPPRAEASVPQVPPTPAPPGAFHTFFAAPSPPRLPRPVAVVLEEQKIAAGSPRAKASSAIAGLAMELEGGLSGGLSFGSAKKKKARGATAEAETGRKRARRGEAEEKPKPAPRKAKRKVQESDDEKEQDDSEDEYVEEAPKRKKPTSPRKRKAPTRELKDEETSTTETEDRVASRKLATSTRRTATSTIKPTPSSSSRVAASKTSIPLAASRSRLSRSTRGAPDSISTSAPTTDDDGEATRPAPLAKKTARTGASSSTVVAPTRKARRVLGGAGQQEAEQEMEVDGVPVVVRRTAARR